VDNINWSRVRTALSQTARRLDASPEQLRDVGQRLPDLLNICGPASRTNRVAIRIGETLLLGGNTLVVPTCPDYSYSYGRYDFKTIRGGVSLLLRKHFPFIVGVLEILPHMQVHVMLADQEADDAALCRATHVDRENFLANVRKSAGSIRAALTLRGLAWQVSLMTEAIPDLREREAQLAQWIAQEAEFARHIDSDTHARREMYRRMRLRGSALRRLRTIDTAAQYVALGEIAQEHNWLIVNHTTTNLAWYLRSRVGFLHNQVRVY